jgi:hypothetical protein
VRVAVTPTVAPVHSAPLPLPFDTNLSGAINQSEAVGGSVIDMLLAVHGGPAPGQLRIRLAGAPDGGGGLAMTGSQVDLLLHGQPVVMQGKVTQLQGQQLQARVTGGSPSPMYLMITLNIDNVSGRVSGTMHVQGAP